MQQRRLSEVDEIVLSLYARGLTTGKISAHFDKIYGTSVSAETFSHIADDVIERMKAWTSGEGANFWMRALIDLRNRGVKGTVFVVYDGLKTPPEVVGNVSPFDQGPDVHHPPDGQHLQACLEAGPERSQA